MHQRNSCESVCPSFGSLRISLTHMCNFSDSFCAPCLIHTTHTCVHSMRVLINVIALYYIFFFVIFVRSHICEESEMQTRDSYSHFVCCTMWWTFWASVYGVFAFVCAHMIWYRQQETVLIYIRYKNNEKKNLYTH